MDLDGIEFFAGKRAVTKAMQRRGIKAVPFERDLSKKMDLCTAAGFGLALQLMIRLMPSGIIWLAPVCSSWVWVNRSTAGRNPVHALGRVDLPHVAEGNMQASRAVALILIATYKGCAWILEQPLSSYLEYHPRFQALLGAIKVYSVVVHLGAYKAKSMKTVRLYSNMPWVRHLRRAVPAGTIFEDAGQVTVKYTDKRGAQRVKGGPKLKASQSYPVDFGNAVADIFCEHRASMPLLPALASVELDDVKRALRMTAADDAWEDAEMTSVLSYLQGHGTEYGGAMCHAGTDV